MFVVSSRMHLMLEWHMLAAAIAQNVPGMRYNLALTSLYYNYQRASEVSELSPC